MIRRVFSFLAVVALLPIVGSAATGSDATQRQAKAPFKVLYSNDTTNTVTCISPWHEKRAPFTDDALRASIDEAAGADAHLLQPGMGWIPWWKSAVYPAQDHYRYYQEKYNVKPNTYGQYMLAGGDIVRTFVEHCRRKKIASFISFRLNDAHGLEDVGKATSMAMHTVSRFYEDHYLEYRLGTNQRSAWHHVLNWAIPEVRQHKLAFIKELCENYDLDGFELDFLRFPNYFQLDKTSPEQRRNIMTGFVREVRQVLDRTAKPGRHRWLCVRIPAMLDALDRLGIDPQQFSAAGVEMFNLSGYYPTIQQTDLRQFRELLPNASIYLELTHTTLTGPSSGYDSFAFLRTTSQQFHTAAHLAYQQGADGLSFFNFAYYREHGGAGRGPFNEPPFEVLKQVQDTGWLAQQPQWYVQAASLGKPMFPTWPLPVMCKAGEPQTLQLELAPTKHQSHDGMVRLRARKPMHNSNWQAAINGVPLRPAKFVEKPLEHPYAGYLGQPEEYACFTCPREAIRVGINQITIRLTGGEPVELIHVDLAIP